MFLFRTGVDKNRRCRDQEGVRNRGLIIISISNSNSSSASVRENTALHYLPQVSVKRAQTPAIELRRAVAVRPAVFAGDEACVRRQQWCRGGHGAGAGPATAVPDADAAPAARGHP